VVGNAATATVVGNIAIFFIFKNGERMKVKENKSIGLAVHKPEKRSGRTVIRLHCSIQKNNTVRLIKDWHTLFWSTLEQPWCVIIRDENGTDIFRPYSRPNPFRWALIRPYPSLDI
jgi:hypothetical protein